MHILEKIFIDLLRGNLCVDDKKIYTGNRNKLEDISPCVQLKLAAENSIRRKTVEIDCKQYIQKEYTAELWIDIYCNTEEQREKLIQQIKNRINQALANHYTTCANYDNDLCSKTDETCKALTSNNSRSNKNQCPDLEIYDSFFKHNHITKRTFKKLSETNLDELEISESLLRTQFKFEMNYYTYYLIGGRPFEDYCIDKE